MMNTNTYKLYNKLLKSQYVKQESTVKWQEKRLRFLIKYVNENIPYYHYLLKSLRLVHCDFYKLEDLSKLPVITKYDIRKNYKLFQPLNKIPYHEHQTSGTSGTPFLYKVDQNTLSITRAIALRGWNFLNYRIGDKMITIGGLSILPSLNLENNLRNKINRSELLSPINLNYQTIDWYINYIKTYKPKYIRGFPSFMYMIACYINNNNIEIDNFYGILTTGENLYQYQRDLIKDVFKCDLIDQCGTYDGGEYFSECPYHSGYHIGVERSIHEFLNDNDEAVSDGKIGKVVVTDLWNYAMPFIRYVTDDLAVPSSDLCGCGRTLPLIKKLEGRISEQIVLNDGKLIPGLVLGDIFEEKHIIEYVIDYRIVQEAINYFTIFVVPTKNKLPPQIEAEIYSFFNKYVGNEVQINFQYLEKIDRTKGNKRKNIESKILADYLK